MITIFNILIFTLAVYTQSILFARFDIVGLVPNIVLILILTFNLFRKSYESFAFAFIAGFVLDVMSAGPFGLHVSVFMLTAFLTNLLVQEDHTKISNMFSAVFLLVVSVIYYGALLIYLFIVTKDISWVEIGFTLGQVGVTFGLFILTFPFLKQLFLWEEKTQNIRVKS